MQRSWTWSRGEQAAAGEAASAGRAAADDHSWELHVVQPKFLSWQQLFVETPGVLKRAPFYGPCDNNRECCNVITRVAELQRSDVSLCLWPLSSSWGREGLFRGISPIPASCKMDRWRKKSQNTLNKQAKKSNRKLCSIVNVIYNWHCLHICYFYYVVSVLQGWDSQGSVLISGLQTQTSICLVSLAGPINLTFLFCIVVWLQQKHDSMPSCRLTCSSHFWETGAAD